MISWDHFKPVQVGFKPVQNRLEPAIAIPRSEQCVVFKTTGSLSWHSSLSLTPWSGTVWLWENTVHSILTRTSSSHDWSEHPPSPFPLPPPPPPPLPSSWLFSCYFFSSCSNDDDGNTQQAVFIRFCCLPPVSLQYDSVCKDFLFGFIRNLKIFFLQETMWENNYFLLYSN